MAGTAVNLVSSYYQKAQEYLQALDEWKVKLTEADLAVKDLERQKRVHDGNGDAVNAGIVVQRLTQANAIKLDAQLNVAKYQKLYDDAEKLYLEKKDTLLSSDESKTLDDKLKAETALLKNTADAGQLKLFAQKNTQYLIYGGIAIVLIVVGMVIFKKYARG